MQPNPMQQPGGMYGPPGGYPASMGPRPPVPNQPVYNGAGSQQMRGPPPSGYGAGYGPPGGNKGMPPPTSNGPQVGGPPPGPHGDQFMRGPPPSHSGGYHGGPPQSMANGPPMSYPPSGMSGQNRNTPTDQLSNQMGSMSMSGMAPRPGMPPTSVGPQMYSPMGGPPTSMAPPTNTGPPSSMAPPMGMAPPTRMNPPSSIAPPSSMGPPTGVTQPTNMPPHTGMPTNIGLPGGMPPSTMAGVPPRPPSSSGYGVPPMPGGPPHSTSPGSRGQMPPSSMGTSYNPSMMGMPPTSTPGAPHAGAPPMGGQQPMPGITPPPMGGNQYGSNVPGGMGGSDMGQPPMAQPGMGQPPMSQPPMGQPPMGQPHMSQPPMGQPPMGQPHMGQPPMGQPHMGQPPMGQPPMGQPGMAGQNQYGGGPGQAAPNYSGMNRGPTSAPGGPMPGQPQQPRRLDPDQMPSPIQVINDDKIKNGGLFQTGGRGLVPPLVTTNIICEDQGNSNPRFLRSTMYNVPVNADMMKQSHIPFAISIAPFASLHPKENPPPVVNLGELGPVRCNRCKAYMCPNMVFIDGGRRFQCCFCSCATEVPPEYFAHLDHTGRRVDSFDRPELCLGSYEFVATKDYCKNGVLPQQPAFIFMIDVSYNSVRSGLVSLICSRLKEVISNLPKEAGTEESEMRVGFVTYAKQIHFYNVKSNLAQPQMMVVSDVQDVFVPLLDGFLVKPSESEAVIDSLLAQIPTMFADCRETEVVLGPVIQAGLDALKSAECSGKLFIFHTTMPIAEAPGKLKNRDDRKLLGTEKEKTLLTPQIPFYTKLGEECVAAGCGVDLFLFPNSYMDIATIAEVPRLTGGHVYKYTYFQVGPSKEADLDGERFIDDLIEDVQRPIAFDCIMRIRTSTGIRPVDFLGNFYMSNTTDVELAVSDSEQSISVEIKHDDKLQEADGAYIQAAVLYTSVSGQRRLRCLNLALNCCSQMADLFRNCELDALVNHMAKSAIRGTLNTTPKTVRESLTNQCAQILACYRKNCASPSSAGQLILPECMKLLPVYTNCVIKSPALQSGSEISTDERCYQMHLVNAMPVKSSCVFFYPRLLMLHELDENSTFTMPESVRCSYERLKENGVYLLENGIVMYMWIGMSVSVKWVQDVFGVQSAAQIDIDKTQLHDLDNQLSRKVREIVKKIRQERNKHMKLVIIRQRDKLEPTFQQYLVEDRSSNGSTSYVDFLCHIHKEIRNLLS